MSLRLPVVFHMQCEQAMQGVVHQAVDRSPWCSIHVAELRLTRYAALLSQVVYHSAHAVSHSASVFEDEGVECASCVNDTASVLYSCPGNAQITAVSQAAPLN